MEQKTEASQSVDEPVLPHLPRAVGYRHTMDNTEGIKGNKPQIVFAATKPNPFGMPGLDYSASFPVATETLFTADQMKAYARAALKAQPAPTEAQGDVLAGYTKWMHDSSKFPHNSDTRHPFDAFTAGADWAQLSGNSGELHAASAAVVARWDSPKWKDEPHTAVFIDRLRKAIELSGNTGELAQGEDSARLVDILEEIMQSAPRNVGRWAGGNAPGHCHAVAGIWDPDNGAKAGLKCGWCNVWRRADEEVSKFRARASAETGGVKS